MCIDILDFDSYIIMSEKKKTRVKFTQNYLVHNEGIIACSVMRCCTNIWSVNLICDSTLN